MGRVVEGIDVQREVRGRLVERGDELVEQHVLQAKETAGADGVLEPRERGLAGQIPTGDRPAADELEDRIAPQHIVGVLVRVVGQNAIHPGASHLQERVVDVSDLPAIGEGRGKLLRQAQLLVPLPEGQQTCIAGNLGGRRLNHHRLRSEKVE